MSESDPSVPGSGSELIELPFFEGTTMPIPDWEAVRESEPDQADLDGYWRNAALSWLHSLKEHLPGPRYAIAQSANFAVLSSLTDKQVALALQFCERSRQRILRALPGVASEYGHGPHVVLVFDTIEEYYEYIDHYYPESGEFAMSSGMFIREGYGHFVFVLSALDGMEPIIVHELTHCLVAALPIPLWVNEGTAVNMEKHLIPHLRSPRFAPYSPTEMERMHAAYWNEDTIQEFWSGESFYRPDQGSGLSYDLAEKITQLVARDYGDYSAFMNSAQRSDGGKQAAVTALGYPLQRLVESVLGEGDWEARPERWSEGTEDGPLRVAEARTCTSADRTRIGDRFLEP